MHSHTLPRRRASLLLALALESAFVCLLAACGDDSTGPDTRYPPGLHLLAGHDVTDTVDAVQTQPLVVRVVGADGRPLRRTVVRFTSTGIHLSFSGATMLVSPLTTNTWFPLAADSTDDEGQAAVRVKMASVVGPAGIVVSVPVLGLIDTAAYTVRPGAAARVTIAPKDTALRIGGNR